MAIVTTGQNIRFDTTLNDVVVLDETGDTRTVIVWDNLSVNDQTILTSVINDLGGDAPMIAPIAGYAEVLYASPITDNYLCGLRVNDAEYLFTEIDIVYDGISPDPDTPSGLDTSGPATHGYQQVSIEFASDATGLANDATIYTATITVDGVVKNIDIVGSTAQTTTALLTEINNSLEGAAVAIKHDVSAIDYNTGQYSLITVTSATTGSTSTIDIVDGTLFVSLDPLAEMVPAMAGRDDTGGAGKIYTATIEVDNVLYRVEVNGNTGSTFREVLFQLNTGVLAGVIIDLWEWESGSSAALYIDHNTGGANTSIRVYDTGLFSSLTGFRGMYPADYTYGYLTLGRSVPLPTIQGNYVVGFDGIPYTCVINVDGTDIPISYITGTYNPPIADLVADIDTQLGGAATAAIVDGKIRITSATTGPGSSVTIKNDIVFNRTTGYVGQRSVPGASNLLEAFKKVHTPTGVVADNYFPRKTVGVRPPDPLRGVTIPKTIQYIYWGGTPADWRYFNDDSVV